ncbi:hypothetical protein [Longimicrobium sp.]|uniref:hypothetical protein n=1 Tax=Longimicrobium sp. TaxID=2029185 RepID=UPI003B3AF10D
MRLVLVLLAVAAWAPLHAQPSARRLPACIAEASLTAGTELTRRGCAGTGRNEAVRVSIALPTNWQIAFHDTADMTLTAMDGDNAVWVVGSDRLPAPVNRADTLNFWARATELLLDRDVTTNEVRDFRESNGGRVASARDWITRSQLRESSLLALVAGLSVSLDGHTVLHSEKGVRSLAGEPAGYLSESLEQGGQRWRFTSYATVRDGALFIVSLNTLESDYAAMLPLFERMLASFNPRTERW